MVATTGVTESSPGVFEASAAGAFLNVADIHARLAAGNDVSISSGSDGTQAGNITWNAGANLDYNGVGSRSLTIRNDDSSTVGNLTFNGRILDSVAGDDDLAVGMTSRRAMALNTGSSIATVDGGIALHANHGLIGKRGLFNGILVKGTLTSSGAGDIEVSGRSGVSTNSSRNGVVLDHATLASSGSGDVRIEGIAATIPVRMLAATITSSGSGDVSIAADDVSINSTTTINAGANDVSFAPMTSGISILLGGTSETADNLDLQAGELNRITAGLVRIGNLTAATTATTRIPTWDITIPRAYAAPAGWNTLSLIGRGLISQTTQSNQSGLTVTNLAAVGFNGVHLPSAKNSISQIAGEANGRNFSVVNLPTKTLMVGTVDGLSGIDSTEVVNSGTGSGGDVYLKAAAGIVVDQAIKSGGNTGGVLQVGAHVTQNVAPMVADGDVRLNAGTLPVAGTDRLVFPAVYTTRSFLIDPANNYADDTVVYFDAIANVQRVNIYINNPEPRATTILLRFDLGVGFQFDENGANAFSFELTTKLTQFAFTSTMEVLNSHRVGNTITEQLREHVPNGNTATFNVTRTPGSNVVTPVNVFTNNDSTLVNFQQWVNFQASSTSLNPNYFGIPATFPLPDERPSLPIGTNHTLFLTGITAPLPMDVVRVGSPAQIEVRTELRAPTLDVLLSKDGGRTFPITIATGLDGTQSSPLRFSAGGFRYTFTPTAAMRTPTASLRIVLHNADGSTSTFDSLEPFAIT